MLRAPALAAGIVIATFVFALPMALLVRDALEDHLGPSLQADEAVTAWNAGWAAEFAAGATGLGRTFTHEILGFGGTLAIASRLADAESLDAALALAAAAYVALWIFLSGGVIDRLARGRPVRAAAFFAACGVYFLRFLRLGVIVGAAYWALFRWVHPYLFGNLYNGWTRDMTVERDAVLLRAGLYLVFFAAFALVNMVADYAKVRAVVEDRRSMLSALLSAIRFVRRRVFRTAGLYVMNVLVLAAIIAVWFLAAPSAAAAPWVALLVGQVYLLARIWTRLAFMASEAVFFQGELAHAQYTAAPDLVWPDSPAAEAIENLTRQA